MEIEILGKKRIVPDFMIAGAMKCGTTSLHHILSHHPLIFIPNSEIHFYDMDNYAGHRDFFLYSKNQWYYPSFCQDLDQSFNWYESWFKDIGDKKFIGEDSTIYLASMIAHKRIARYAPDTKIVIMLRDPASRTYSQYCHLVLTGRINCTFEKAIQQGLGNLIERSFYQQQIEHFFQLLPRNNFYFILFEEFIKETDEIVNKLLTFLDIPVCGFNLSQVEKHQNKSQVPNSLTLHKLRNFLIKDSNNLRYANFYSSLTGLPQQKYNTKQLFYRVVNKINNLINPLQNKKFPQMKSETRRFLNDYLKQQNEDLSELICKKVENFWYKES